MIKKTAAPSQDLTVVAIHNRLFFRLFQVGNTFQRKTNQQLGISTVQWAVLGALAGPRASQGMSVSALAELIVVSRQNLDGVLTRLERENHVSRIPDKIDRRSRQVVLTTAGAKFWEEIQPTIYEFYRQAVKDFRFDEKVALVHFLNKLQQDLGRVELVPGAEPTEMDSQ